MKLLTLIFVMLGSSLFAQKKGIQFFQGTYQEALEEAKKQKKPIFFDAFAEWCGPCKQMANNVFTNEVVGDYYNKYFINVKMDMEKGEGPQLSSKFSITAYPTLIFIDSEGKIIQSVKGGKNVDQFLALGKNILLGSTATNITALEEEYEKGNKEASFLKSYAYALLLQDKPNMKIANEYLRTQSDITSEENINFIFEYALEADSRIFNLMLENIDRIKANQTEAAFRRQIEKACNNTVKKAVEFNTPSLLKDAKTQMKKAIPAFAKEYESLADIQYYTIKQDYANLTASIENYLKKFAQKDAQKHYDYALLIVQNVQDKSALQKAEKWAKQAVDLETKVDYLKAYIYLLQVNGSNEKELVKRQEQLKQISAPKAS